MTLHAALVAVLVAPGGPLANLYAARLPARQTAAVDVAAVVTGGPSPQRYLGSAPVVGGPRGVTTDGGVLWHRSAVQFQCRGEDPDDPHPVAAAADAIRDVLVQYAGASVVRAGELIVRIDLTTTPAYFGQDTQERALVSLAVEVWHR